MSLLEEIDIRIKEIEEDYTYKRYLKSPAQVDINAPLALIEATLLTEIKTLRYVRSGVAVSSKIEDVQRLCEVLGLSDWTKKDKEGPVSTEEALIILDTIINTNWIDIPIEQFRKALVVELEHGMICPDANITNNHPLMTGKIALAHFVESMDYYLRLEIAGIEADMSIWDTVNPTRLKDLINAKLALLQFSMGKLEG